MTITRRGYLADNFSIHKVRLSWSFWGKFLDRNIHILSIWTFSSIWVSTSFRWRVSPCLLYDQILKTVRVFWKLLFKKFTFEKHKRGIQSFCSWFWVVSHIICKSYYSLNIFGITWLIVIVTKRLEECMTELTDSYRIYPFWGNIFMLNEWYIAKFWRCRFCFVFFFQHIFILFVWELKLIFLLVTSVIPDVLYLYSWGKHISINLFLSFPDGFQTTQSDDDGSYVVGKRGIFTEWFAKK